MCSVHKLFAKKVCQERGMAVPQEYGAIASLRRATSEGAMGI